MFINLNNKKVYWPICFHGFLIGHMGNGKVLAWLFWSPLGFLHVLPWSQDVCGDSVSHTHAVVPKDRKSTCFSLAYPFLKLKFKIHFKTQKCLMFYWLHLGSLSLKHWGVGLITLVQTNQSLSSQERIHTSWNMGPHRRWASERICQQ